MLKSILKVTGIFYFIITALIAQTMQVSNTRSGVVRATENAIDLAVNDGAIQPGDTLVVYPGVYRGFSVDMNVNSLNIISKAWLDMGDSQAAVISNTTGNAVTLGQDAGFTRIVGFTISTYGQNHHGVFIMDGTANNITIASNIFSNVGQTAIFDNMSFASGLRVYHNLILDSGWFGINLDSSSDFILANNTLISTSFTGINLQSADNGLIVNNLIDTTGDYGCENNGGGAGLKLSNNLFFNLGAGPFNGFTIEGSNISGSPPILTPDFTPASGSPAIDNGQFVPGITGMINGPAPDIGWKEYYPSYPGPYYVNTMTGDDIINTGEPHSPFQSIQKALDMMSDPANSNVAYFWGWFPNGFIPTASGTPIRPLKCLAWSNDNPPAISGGNTAIEFSGGTGNFIHFIGWEFSGQNNRALWINGNDGIGLINCRIHNGSGLQTVIFSGGLDHIFNGNLLYDNNSGAALQITSGARMLSNEIRNNAFYNLSGANNNRGINDMDGYPDLMIINNTFASLDGYCVYAPTANNLQVINNIFYDCGEVDAAVWGPGAGSTGQYNCFFMNSGNDYRSINDGNNNTYGIGDLTNTDPYFESVISADSNFLHLSNFSLCIDNGDPNYDSWPGTMGGGIDIGAYESPYIPLPPPDISINDISDSETVGNVQFTVTLSSSYGGDIFIDYNTSDDSATAPGDYDTASGTLMIPSGDSNGFISITINDDAMDETDETYSVNLNSANYGVITDGTGTGTIIDDDPTPWVNISDVTISESTGTATFWVELTGVSGQDASVNFSTSGVSAAAGTDFTSASGTCTVLAGNLSNSITVTITSDTSYENNETFTLDLSTPVNCSFGDNQAVCTIIDDDSAPAIVVADISVDESAGIATFWVELSAVSGLPASVDYWITGDTAVSGTDFISSSGTCNINTGQLSNSITVNITDDMLDEIDETFNLDLSSPSECVFGDNQAIGTIIDDDPLSQLNISDETETENMGIMSFDVSLSAISGKTVSVDYVVLPNTALHPADYTSNMGTLTFIPGDTSETINISISDDFLYENAETFNVTLSSPNNATISDDTGIGTIVDDDSAPIISIADVMVSEAAGTATFWVELTAASGLDASVNYTTADNTASSGSDYSAASGTLNILAGALSNSITVTITSDFIDENDETFFIDLSTPVNCSFGDSQALGTIIDDDSAPTIAISDESELESVGTMTFTISLSAVSGLPVSVNWTTVNVSALSGSDYTAGSGTAAIPAGNTSATIDISITDDGLSEGNETFTIDLSAPANAVFADNQATGTIVDNDGAPTLFIGDVTVNESAGIAVFWVELTGMSAMPVSVDWTSSNLSATNGVDFTAAGGTVGISAGNLSNSLTISITDDMLDENNETFEIYLNNPANAAISDNLATGTITDNDLPPTVSIADISADEAAGSATFWIVLSEVSGLAASVNYTTTGVTATSGLDFTAASGTCNINAGQLSNSVVVSIIDDGDDDDGETFTLDLSVPLNCSFGDNQSVCSIIDDDVPGTSWDLRLESIDYSMVPVAFTAFQYTPVASFEIFEDLEDTPTQIFNGLEVRVTSLGLKSQVYGQAYLYKDTINPGTWDVGDTMVNTADVFAGGDFTLSCTESILSSNQGTPDRYFLVYGHTNDLSVSLDNTVSFQITNLLCSGPNGGNFDNLGLLAAAPAADARIDDFELTLEYISNIISDPNPMVGSFNNPFLAINLVSDDPDATNYLAWLDVTTNSLNTADTADLGMIKIFRDDGDGVFIAANDSIAAADNFAVDMTARLNFAPSQALTYGNNLYFVVFDIQFAADAGDTIGLQITNGAFAFIDEIPDSFAQLGQILTSTAGPAMESNVTIAGIPTGTPPVVNVPTLSPAAPYYDGDDITVSCTVNDPGLGTTTNVTFIAFPGAIVIGQDNSAPWSATWTTVPGGAYSIYAIAVDDMYLSDSNSTIASIQLPPAPTLTVNSPGNGAWIGTSPVTFQGDGATARGQLTAVLFSTDNAVFSPATGTTNWSISIDVSSLDQTTNLFYSRISNSFGSNRLVITSNRIDLTPPTVTIDGPSAGADISGLQSFWGSSLDSFAPITARWWKTNNGPWIAAPPQATWNLNIDTELHPNGQFIFAVRSANAAGLTTICAVTNNINNSVVTFPPAQVSGVTASDNTWPDQIRITWSKAADASHYRVLRSTNSTGTYLPVSSWLTGSNFMNAGLVPGTTYYYQVIASNANGTSTPSFFDQGSTTAGASDPYEPNNDHLNATAIGNNIPITDALIQVPGDPDYFTFTTTFAGQIRIALSNLPADYDIYLLDADLNKISASFLPGYQNETIIFNTNVTGTYYVLVKGAASQFDGSDPYTLAVNWPTSSSAPGLPAAPSAGDGTSTESIIVSWTVDNTVDAWILEKAASSGGPWTAMTGWTTTTEYSDIAVTAGETNYYRLQASNYYGTGSAGSSDSGWKALAAPASIDAGDGLADTSISLSWATVTDADTYTVSRAVDPTGTWSNIITNTTSLSGIDSNVTSGIIYYYRVLAENSWTVSAQSGIDSGFTTGFDTYESNDTPVQCYTILTSEDTYRSYLFHSGDLDYFQLDLPYDGPVHLYLSNLENNYDLGIARSNDGVFTELSANSGTDDEYLSVTVTGPTNLWIVVRSLFGDWNKTNSYDLVAVFPTNNDPAPAPDTFSGAAVDENSISWTWSSVSPLAYNIYIADENGNDLSGDLDITDTNYLELDLDADSLVSRRLVVVSAYGTNETELVSAYTHSDVPSLTLDENTAHRVTVSWNDSGLSGYILERMESGGSWQQISVESNSEGIDSYSDTDVEPGISYSYRLYSLNKEGVLNPTASQVLQVITSGENISGDVEVWGNYLDCANSTTIIMVFASREDDPDTVITVYNLKGRPVWTVWEGSYSGLGSRYYWDTAEADLEDGVYFIEFKYGGDDPIVKRLHKNCGVYK